MRRYQFNRLTGRGPGGRIGTDTQSLSVVSASITSDGMSLLIAFTRPVTLADSESRITLSGSRSLFGVTVSMDGVVASVTMDDLPMLFGETFVLGILADTLIDSYGTYLAEVVDFPLTNNAIDTNATGAELLLLL